MKYKGIIFDVDGTAVPLSRNVASKRLRQAITAAVKQDAKIAAATGRSYEFAKPIFTSLGLSMPSILLGGSAIINPKTDKVLWHKPMSFDQTTKVLDAIKPYDCDTWVGFDPIKPAVPLKDHLKEHSSSVIYALKLLPSAVPALSKDILKIADVAVHPTPSWTKGRVDLHITHAEATKEHSVRILLKILGIKPSETIGMGDSGNDLPIFKATGYHIAVKNADPLLIAEADEIAPGVEDDGLAKTIEKYFL